MKAAYILDGTDRSLSGKKILNQATGVYDIMSKAYKLFRNNYSKKFLVPFDKLSTSRSRVQKLNDTSH